MIILATHPHAFDTLILYSFLRNFKGSSLYLMSNGQNVSFIALTAFKRFSEVGPALKEST
jgi:hypothetical protein